MSFSMFFNFEKVSSNIIESAIKNMDDCNTLREAGMEEEQMNMDHFTNNLYYGSIAAVFIANLYETSLNTILTRRLGITDKKILEGYNSKKLQRICNKYNVEYKEIQKEPSYKTMKSIINLRNDITHFKVNDIGDGHYWVKERSIRLGKTKGCLETLFSKRFMENGYQETINFLSLLCDKCGLLLNKDCEIIDSDGKGSLCEFIVDKSLVDE